MRLFTIECSIEEIEKAELAVVNMLDDLKKNREHLSNTIWKKLKKDEIYGKAFCAYWQARIDDANKPTFETVMAKYCGMGDVPYDIEATHSEYYVELSRFYIEEYNEMMKAYT